ncbi:MAG: CBS domain-containing protein [Planctomycetes bacterium]|nr:CBS domain-containing protein [Planctomycetota bacterium]
MKTAGQLAQARGDQVWSIGPGEALSEALKLMSEKSVEALLVLENGKMVGIVSTRDHTANCVRGRCAKVTPVDSVMSKDVPCVGADKPLEQCLALMSERRARHLPVIDEKGRVVGVISFKDVANAMLSEREFIIEQLENYIIGWPG